MHYKKSVFRSLAMVTQLGLCVVTPIFLCIFAGYYIDSYFGTKSMVVLLVIGAMAGGRGAYLMAKKTLEAECREDEEERLKSKKPGEEKAVVHKPKQPSRVRKGNTKTAGTGREEFDE